MEHKGYSKNTILTYRRAIKDFINFSGEKNAKQLTSKIAYNYVSQLPLAPRSLNTRISALCSWFAFMKNTGETIDNIFDNSDLRAKTPSSIPKGLTPEEINTIWGTVKEKYVNHFKLMLYAGLRVGEVCRVSSDDIQKINGIEWIRIRGKGNKERLTPFLSPEPIIIPENRTSEAKLKSYVFRMAKKLGFHLTCHRLRHTFATLVLNKGVRIEVLSQWMGHANIATTQIYAKLYDVTSQNAAKLFLDTSTN